MRRTRIRKRSWLPGVGALLLAVHHFVLRPWFLNWGAPHKIQTASFPGDRFTLDKGHTRAVLIHATPEAIWPWIVQLGQDRGGMYSYSWLENLVRADIHNVYQIKKELQVPRMEGDTIWLANRNRYKGRGFQMLALPFYLVLGIHRRLNNPKSWQTRSMPFFVRTRRLVAFMSRE